MYLQDLIGLRQTRRSFLTSTATGVGAVALTNLLNLDARGDDSSNDASVGSSGMIQPLHHAAKAKRVIFLCQAGGASHLETFDYKPKLAEMHGQPMPESITKGQPIAQLQGQKLNCFGPQHPFEQYGESGQSICSIFPHLGEVADELCIINSMTTEAINHDPAHTFMNTGSLISGRPAMGSWLTYGLGVEADDLPGFVVLTSVGRFGQAQPIAARQWHSGFLPSRHQGVEFRSTGDPVLYVTRPKGVSSQGQSEVVEAVNALNRIHEEAVEDPEVATRIAQYELAFKMQTSVPELMDLSQEPEHVLDMYGTEGADGSYAANCLLARRLAERGVRFIQLYHRGWDHHGGIKDNIAKTATEVDQATAALIKDLKQRDMLKDTLVVFGGEFGRTPMAQGNGRDHHMKGFSHFMCGGGIKSGFRYGATDELGYNSVEDVVRVHDMHATMLHLLGIDHERFKFKYQGLDMRLTGVEGANIIDEILA